MSAYAKSVLAIVVNLALGSAVGFFTGSGETFVAFIAGSALWWGIRAYYEAVA